MNAKSAALLSLLLLVIVPAGWSRSAESAPQPSRPEWPGFRGPGGLGAAPADANPPAKLDLARDVRWKIALPVEGNGAPILAGGRVFVTGEKQEIVAFDAATGKQLWLTTLPPAAGEVEAYVDTGLAAPTPCTDGQRIVAFFGTGLLACTDLQGKVLWSTRVVGEIDNAYGLAGSPILYRNLVILVVDMGSEEDGKSFIAAYDIRNGAEVWKAARPVDAGWASPTAVAGKPNDVLLVNGRPRAIAYDPASGKELSRAEGITGDTAASPAASGSLAFFCGDSFGTLLAVNIATGKVAWTTRDDLPDVASLACAGGRLYIAGERGKVTCRDAAAGKLVWERDLNEQIWASPIVAAGRVYVLTKPGKLSILAADSGKVLGSADFAEPAVATPAVAGKSLFVRTSKHLWRLEQFK